jgi:hypothetical protein
MYEYLCSLRQKKHSMCCARFVVFGGGQTGKGTFCLGGVHEVEAVNFERREA